MPSFNDYINSNYLEAYNKMLSKNSVRSVVVYVEAEEDIAFWRDILHHYQTIHQVKFEIKTPTNSRGKSGLISNKNLDLVTGELGNSLLICVDSDYDYILADFYENKEKKERAKK